MIWSNTGVICRTATEMPMSQPVIDIGSYFFHLPIQINAVSQRNIVTNFECCVVDLHEFAANGYLEVPLPSDFHSKIIQSTGNANLDPLAGISDFVMISDIRPDSLQREYFGPEIKSGSLILNSQSSCGRMTSKRHRRNRLRWMCEAPLKRSQKIGFEIVSV